MKKFLKIFLPVMLATLVAIISTFIQIAIVFARGKKPEPMLWISLAVIVVFGSLTEGCFDWSIFEKPIGLSFFEAACYTMKNSITRCFFSAGGRS